MTWKPRDRTKQENLVGEILTSLGVRYNSQVQTGPYTLDFVCYDNMVVIEADGIYGHLKKQDEKRDKYLLESGFSDVWHIRETTKSGIRKILEQKFKEEQCRE